MKYFEENLNANVKIPKKGWELLRQATIGTKQNKNINKIVSNGEQSNI
jgi:hypothetical protein